jgi:hypothetical protein
MGREKEKIVSFFGSMPQDKPQKNGCLLRARPVVRFGSTPTHRKDIKLKFILQIE